MKGNSMRKVSAVLFVTLDGVVESPEKWPARYFDGEVDRMIGLVAAQSDAILLGRCTYEELAEYWPQQPEDVPLARYMNETPKYVVSSGSEDLDWPNSTRLAGDLATELAELKQQPGKDIRVIGSPTLVRSLLRDGLLDELTLLVHPIVAGGGRRLFDDLVFATTLQLADSCAFDTGVVCLTFQPVRTLAAVA